MKSRHLFCLFFLVGVAAVSLAGDIQVSCPPDLRVYLDDQLMGTSSTMQDGLFLMNVRRGTHMIRVEKDGYIPQNIQVEVSDFPIEVRVGALTPAPAARPEKEVTAVPVKEEKEVGYLIITSAPQNCTVEIDGKAEIKETPRLSLDRLAVGEHTISFSKSGYETISGVVKILPGVEVTVRGNLIDSEIETLYEGKGSLRVKSTPVRCDVVVAGKKREKTKPKLNLSHIPAGEYKITLSIPGRTLSRNITILDRQRTVVEVDFTKKKDPFVVYYVPF